MVRPSHPIEGRRPSSRTLRWDAVAAEVTKTNVAEADGEVVSFRRPKLASSLAEMICEAMVAIEHVSPGRPRISRKTIAQGRPGVLRWTCMLVCAPFCAHCTRDRGCSAHPAFPAPSVLEEGENLRKTRASRAARMRTHTLSLFEMKIRCLTRHCERSEAIHAATPRKNGLLRRFAPRNDGKVIPAPRPPAGGRAGGAET
jgi:hypothetical protein